jgi:farnesyl-diphosphate farnesyltransferase
MVTDALRHAPKCLEYMAQLEDPQVFAFCAIPQVMAIATLTMCYDNGKVFEGVVKMRRGQTAVVRTPFPSMQDHHSEHPGFFFVMAAASRACLFLENT